MTVEVGPSHKKYLIHTAFLTHYATTPLNAITSSHYGMGGTNDQNALALSAVDPVVFDIFVDWIYTQKLPQLPGLLPPTEGWDCLLMVKCLHFSVEYRAEAFGEAINNVFVDTVFTTGLNPHYPTIIYA
jgi:hypothetical protein